MGKCADLRSYSQPFTHHGPLSRHCFLPENQTSSHRPHHFPTYHMTDQPGSARFQELLESALQVYEKKGDIPLADGEHSLAIRLQGCHSIDDIAALLQYKAQAFDNLQQRDRILKSIKATVSILTPISTVASVADNAGLVRLKVLEACLAFLTVLQTLPPYAKAIHSTLGIVLDVCTIPRFI